MWCYIIFAEYVNLTLYLCAVFPLLVLGEISGPGVRVHVPIDMPQPDDANLELSVQSATLHLYRLYTHMASLVDSRTVDQQVRVDVYQLLEDPDQVESPMRRLLDSKLVDLEKDSSWEDFNIAGAVTDWLEEPSSNFGLELSSASQPIHEVVTFALRRGRSGQREIAPRVSIYTQERSIIPSRSRRHAPETYDCQQGDGESRCCRYPLWISFKDIGWDKWVVQPKGYQAYFCDGSCPHSYKVAHNFANIKSLINLANPRATPAPCCTASKLSPLPLMHYNDHGHMVVTVYDDMIVEQCKCA